MSNLLIFNDFDYLVFQEMYQTFEIVSLWPLIFVSKLNYIGNISKGQNESRHTADTGNKSSH